AMLLTGKRDIGRWQPLGSQGVEHALALTRRHNFVFKSLKKKERGGDSVGGMDRGTCNVETALRRVGPDEAIKVAALELMCIAGQRLDVADSEVAGTGLEQRTKCQGRERREPPSAPAADQEPLRIGKAL